jgi:UDP-2-acetamido-3-amino-2,3-dideoxy-glucuronate N-acetyltransferase
MTLPAMTATLETLKVDTLPTMRDARGALTVAEFDRFVPFAVVRLFYVREVPPNTMRGQHAHFRCKQYAVCVSGCARIDLTDGTRERSVTLSPGQAVLIEPGIFAAETYLDADSVLLFLCDRAYEKDDYIHTLDEFLRLRRP